MAETQLLGPGTVLQSLAENRFPRFWAVSQEQKWPGQRSNTMLKWNDSLNLVVPSTYSHVYEIQREFSSARS